MSRIGILLVNLGTPNSQDPGDVRKYLTQFLTDGRVIDTPWLSRQFLVRGIIVPKRYKESAANYSRIWTEMGSPLLYHGERVRDLLRNQVGEEFQVELAMRYQQPSIETVLDRMRDCHEMIILPLFPQYASATTGSVHQEVMRVISGWLTIPELQFVNSYPTHPKMIEAFCELGKQFSIDEYDHILFSFHGLPERHLRNADRNDHCLKQKGCCQNLNRKNQLCYSAQCHATGQEIAKGIGVNEKKYTICFQSRLGKDPWVRPYTSDMLDELLQQGKKNILVFSPAFVCDCLETIDEIGNEYRAEFLSKGGEKLDLVPGLNDHPLWIEALQDLVLSKVTAKAV